MDSSAEVLIKLLRIALGNETSFSLPNVVDWQKIIDMSFQQGVGSIAIDGLQKIYDSNQCLVMDLDKPELENLKYDWFGQAVNDEVEFSKREAATKQLVNLWASDGISTTILKGASFARYYPIPEHRYSCDLDLFVGDDWQKGCKILEKQGIDICYEVYKDAQFHIGGIYVECHRYLMSIRGNKTLQNMEKYLRSLLIECREQTDVVALYYPPVLFNALFCIEHARAHILHERMTLHQVCDWMLLRKQPVDWSEFWKRCDEFGLTRFAKVFDHMADWIEGKLCLEDMSDIEKRVVKDMFEVDQTAVKPASFFNRRLLIVRDTIKNGWKYKEFNDVSMPVSLVRQIWTHFFAKEVHLDNLS